MHSKRLPIISLPQPVHGTPVGVSVSIATSAGSCAPPQSTSSVPNKGACDHMKCEPQPCCWLPPSAFRPQI